MRIPNGTRLYDLMRRWVDDCLLMDGSLLEPGAEVWTGSNLASMKQRFIDDPNEDPDVSFEEKLAGQGEGATREVKLLAAEVRAVQLMPMAEVSRKVKRKEIAAILDALGVSAEIPKDVDAAMSVGFAGYGMAKVHKYWHLCLIIDRALAFKRLDVNEQQRLLTDPFAWKRFVQANTFKKVGSQENMLLHIVHPDQFEPIPSGSDKMKIARALDSYAGGESDVDAALHKIHTYLNEKSGGWVSLYGEDVRPLWDQDAKSPAPAADEEQEAAWQQTWADWLVRHYRHHGGPPTIPDDDPGLGERIATKLRELEKTGDIDAWLQHLRTEERPALKHIWLGAHARTHRAIVAEATDPAAAARLLATSLLAPETDEQAVAKIRQLQELVEPVNGGVHGSVLAAMVWHWQDPSIAPIGLGVERRLAARGWFDAPKDEAEFFLAHTERVAGFDQPVPWIFAALAKLETEAFGLDAMPSVDFERCAHAAAGQPAATEPVIADLELVVLSLRRHLRLGDEASTARSQARGPAVWVDVRRGGSTLIRLWGSPEGLTLARPGQADGDRAEGLYGVDEQGGLPVLTRDAAPFEGRMLPRKQAEDPALIREVADLLAPSVGTVGTDLRPLFDEFTQTVDEEDLTAIEGDRQQLAAILTPGALATPDLDALRQIINTGRYGSPGPMSALNSSVTQAAEEGHLDELGAVFDRLCNGDGQLADRIDEAMGAGVSGLGSSVIMKMLAITHPSRVLPVFPLHGNHGKESILRALELPLPPASGSEGTRQMAANDTLLEAVRGLTTNLWEAKNFFYWAVERLSAQLEDDDEDRLARVVDDCYVPRSWVDEVVALLDDRKQMVFYGPPGTGKTWIALQLAEALAPDPLRRELVQFHPAYGYEDFFEGFRPRTHNGTLTYELSAGPLKTFAEAAAADPRRKHVLIIDEINRANLPKVFGELLFLLEYRDRSAKTMYGGVPFRLPENLFIIATMNTADRSIALVDAAMRRRFHFVPLFPDREPLTGTLRAWLEDHGEKPWIAELLEHVNSELVRRLGGPHLQVGPSHFMRHGITESIGRVWRYTIEPLIEEQLFGDEAAIDSLRWAPVAKRIAPTAVAVSIPDGEADIEPDAEAPVMDRDMFAAQDEGGGT